MLPPQKVSRCDYIIFMINNRHTPGLWNSNARFTALLHTRIQQVLIQNSVQGWVQGLWYQTQTLFIIWWDIPSSFPAQLSQTPKATSTDPDEKQGKSIWEMQTWWVNGEYFSIPHGEVCHQCTPSSETGGYPSCRDPTLLPEFHDLLPKLHTHKLRGSNIRKAKALAVLAAVTGNSSGSVLQLKREQNQLYGGYCLPTPTLPGPF